MIEDGNIETPLVNGKECVYVHYNSKWFYGLWY